MSLGKGAGSCERQSCERGCSLSRCAAAAAAAAMRRLLSVSGSRAVVQVLDCWKMPIGRMSLERLAESPGAE